MNVIEVATYILVLFFLVRLELLERGLERNLESIMTAVEDVEDYL